MQNSSYYEKTEYATTYQNGNVRTTIHTDGTKVHFTPDDEFHFSFAESMDICISERCNQGCKFCYAGCTPDGKFGNLKDWKFLTTFHPYTEIAINLQDPTPPDLMSFLYLMKAQNVIVNVTVNQDYFMSESGKQFIKFLIKMELIKGVGISLTNPSQEGFIESVLNCPNAVIHVIAGIVTADDFKQLEDKGLKILILGYKYKGRGIGYYSQFKPEIQRNISWLESYMSEIQEKFYVTAFDNLAIEQFNMQEKFSEEDWEKFYAGDDGTLSFYIDLVNGTFSKSSVSPISYPIEDRTIDEMFEVVRNETDDMA